MAAPCSTTPWRFWLENQRLGIGGGSLGEAGAALPLIVAETDTLIALGAEGVMPVALGAEGMMPVALGATVVLGEGPMLATALAFFVTFFFKFVGEHR